MGQCSNIDQQRVKCHFISHPSELWWCLILCCWSAWGVYQVRQWYDCRVQVPWYLPGKLKVGCRCFSFGIGRKHAYVVRGALQINITVIKCLGFPAGCLFYFNFRLMTLTGSMWQEEEALTGVVGFDQVHIGFPNILNKPQLVNVNVLQLHVISELHFWHVMVEIVLQMWKLSLSTLRPSRIWVIQLYAICHSTIRLMFFWLWRWQMSIWGHDQSWNTICLGGGP